MGFVLVLSGATFARVASTSGATGASWTTPSTKDSYVPAVRSGRWLLELRQRGLQVTALAIAALDRRTIYVGIRSDGVFKSTDGGRSWRRAGLRHQPVQSLVVDPETSDTVYAGEGDLFKSIDGGKSWHKIRSPNPKVGIDGIAVDPKRSNTIFVATTYGCTACDVSGLFKTTDGGRSWRDSAAYLEGGAGAVVIDPANSQHLYAEINVGLEASTNGGKTWRLISRQPHGGVYALALDPRVPHTLYVGTDNGVVKTTDGGRSWQRASGGLPKRPTVSALAVEPDQPHTILAAVSSGTKSGVYRSLDGGHTWKQLYWQLR